MKKEKLIAALNYIVVRFAYEYQVCIDFDTQNFPKEYVKIDWRPYVNRWFNGMSRYNEKKNFLDQDRKLQSLYKERLISFNKRNNFNHLKIHAFLFMVLTASQKNKKYFLELFTEPEEDLYFFSDTEGIKNKAVEDLLARQDLLLFFNLGVFGTQIVVSVDSLDALKKMIVERNFTDDKKEGAEFLDLIEKQADIIANKFYCFATMDPDVCKFHFNQLYSFKVFCSDPLSKENNSCFLELLCAEDFYW